VHVLAPAAALAANPLQGAVAVVPLRDAIASKGELRALLGARCRAPLQPGQPTSSAARRSLRRPSSTWGWTSSPGPPSPLGGEGAWCPGELAGSPHGLGARGTGVGVGRYISSPADVWCCWCCRRQGAGGRRQAGAGGGWQRERGRGGADQGHGSGRGAAQHQGRREPGVCCAVLCCAVLCCAVLCCAVTLGRGRGPGGAERLLQAPALGCSCQPASQLQPARTTCEPAPHSHCRGRGAALCSAAAGSSPHREPPRALTPRRTGAAQVHASRRFFQVLKQSGSNIPVVHHLRFPVGAVRDEIVISTGGCLGAAAACGRGRAGQGRAPQAALRPQSAAGLGWVFVRRVLLGNGGGARLARPRCCWRPAPAWPRRC
jgi:hypothetical protein